MKIALIKKIDISNGPGIRLSIFVSGCRHACPGCFNKDIWDFKKGNELDENVLDEIISYLEKPYISGVSLLGGEPLEPKNHKGIYQILTRIKQNFPNMNIWCYTGFVYEYICENMIGSFKYLNEIINMVDVLVDGRFEIDLLDLKLQFRGSKNQRIIDLKKTRERNTIIWEDSIEDKYKYVKVEKTLPDYMDKYIKRDKNNLL